VIGARIRDRLVREERVGLQKCGRRRREAWWTRQARDTWESEDSGGVLAIDGVQAEVSWSESCESKTWWRKNPAKIGLRRIGARYHRSRKQMASTHPLGRGREYNNRGTRLQVVASVYKRLEPGRPRREYMCGAI
jgi:hypothetical protein